MVPAPPQPDAVKTVLGAALEIQAALARNGERFCIIGAIALLRWGEPRATRDVDVTLLCPFGREASAIDRLLAEFAPRIPEAREFALRNRVLLLWSRGRVGIDVALGALPFEERCIGRSSAWTLSEDASLRTCSAEDLVVLKAFASRAQDWVDVENVLVRQHRSLDWRLVLRELEPLAILREAPEIVSRLREIKARVDEQGL